MTLLGATHQCSSLSGSCNQGHRGRRCMPPVRLTGIERKRNTGDELFLSSCAFGVIGLHSTTRTPSHLSRDFAGHDQGTWTTVAHQGDLPLAV